MVDVEALVRALADGKLRGAGLDVLPQETLDPRRGGDLPSGGGPGRRGFQGARCEPCVAALSECDRYAAQRLQHRGGTGGIIATTLANIEAFAQGAPQNIVSAH